MVFPWWLAFLILFFIFFFFPSHLAFVVLECDVTDVKDMTECCENCLGDVVLPMNSIPSSSAAPFTSRKHVKRGGIEGRREEKREREREREGYSSYNAVEASSYSKFTLGSHTWCKWTIKLGLTWLSLPRGPGNEPSQPAMLGGRFCTLWIPTVAGFGWGEKNKSIRKLRQLKKVNQSFHTQFRHVTNVPFLHLTLWAWQ